MKSSLGRRTCSVHKEHCKGAHGGFLCRRSTQGSDEWPSIAILSRKSNLLCACVPLRGGMNVSVFKEHHRWVRMSLCTKSIAGRYKWVFSKSITGKEKMSLHTKAVARRCRWFFYVHTEFDEGALQGGVDDGLSICSPPHQQEAHVVFTQNSLLGVAGSPIGQPGRTVSTLTDTEDRWWSRQICVMGNWFDSPDKE